MLLTEYCPHDVTSLTLVKAQYGIAPLHPPILVLVVPRRALTCVSPDGERSVRFDILYCMCKFVAKEKDYFVPFWLIMCTGDHHVT